MLLLFSKYSKACAVNEVNEGSYFFHLRMILLVQDIKKQILDQDV